MYPRLGTPALIDEFVKVFNANFDIHAPYCYASRKEQRSCNKPWFTKGILTSTAKKQTAKNI